MPCRYDPGPEDHYLSEKAKNVKMKGDLDRLTAENDRLRDAVLALIEGKTQLHPDVLDIIKQDQIEHRRADLRRLEKVFRESKDAERLGKVMLADPTLPLEPQLGFDADEF